MRNGNPKLDELSTLLSTCDKEPIHIPGAIQPHGVLLGILEPELTVVLASTNTAELLGIEHNTILGSGLADILSPDDFASMRAALQKSSLRPVNPVCITLNGKGMDTILHRSDGLAIAELELESNDTCHEDNVIDREFYTRARDALLGLGEVRCLSELWPLLAALVRRITGFDRVMIYRFCPRDGSGEVIAEACAADMEPYLGLHYPASDIPKQARYLYSINRLRLIPNVSYTPVPLVPPSNPVTGEPLVLSHSVLRSVSPVHREYLTNMGVSASMSISLMDGERLWGLIACHHRIPRQVPYRVRLLCELIGDFTSWMLGPMLDSEQERLRARAAGVHRLLVESMSAQQDLAHALTAGTPTALSLVEAGGFAISYGGKIVTLGNTPPPDFIMDMVCWLGATMEGVLYATDELAASYPPAQTVVKQASGLLAAAVSRPQNFFLLWFRPELLQQVHWAGNPHKPVMTAGERLTPRKSFAMWTETVRGHSQPWAPWEMTAASELRTATATMVLQKAAEIFHLNTELREALRIRDEFMSMASHELRTPMQTLKLQVEALTLAAENDQVMPDKLLLQLGMAQRQVLRVEKLINQLLDVSAISAGRLTLECSLVDLAALAREVAMRFADTGVTIVVNVDGETTGWWDAFRLDQVLMNLLSNAVKYGQGKPIDVNIKGNAERVRCSVCDRGIGISPDAQAKLFGRFERAVSSAHFPGFGLGLWIVRQFIERHGGHIEVASNSGHGSTFSFELPRRVEMQLS